jgi:hypothetical protein
MANRSVFSFSLEGIEVMVANLDKFLADIDPRLEETLTRLAHKVIFDAKKLAPLDEGDLEAALIVGDVKRTIEGMYIDLGVSPEVDHYAVAQHEGFMKTAKGNIVELTPGEKTVSKGAHNGYLPGKKFLENALKMNEALILRELSEIFRG